MNGTFLEFAALCDSLSATTKKLAKRALIAAWLKTLSVEDAGRGALHLAGQPFAETDRRVLNLGGAVLGKAVAEISGATAAEMHTAYLRYGDLGGAAEELFGPRAALEATLTLERVERYFAEIAAAKGPTGKLPLIRELLGMATAVEAKYLIKIALGDMRTGVKESLVEEAIADAFVTETPLVRRATMLKGSLPEVVRLAAEGRLAEARMSLFHPLGFMLASPVDSVEEALARFAQEVVAEKGPGAFPIETDEGPLAGGEVAGEALVDGLLDEAQVEDKFDGIRAQLHCGDPGQPGRVALFSRSKEEMTAAFPELEAAFARLREPLILDGEVLAWDGKTGRALPFSSLQKRIGRKKVTAEMRKQTPVVFMAFDLLYAGGELLLERSLGERRAVLEEFAAGHLATLTAGFETEDAPVRVKGVLQPKLFAAVESSAAERDAGAEVDAMERLVLSKAATLTSADQLDQAYMDARARGNEGVMIKARGSVYQPGRRGIAWLKLKRQLATLDVVVTAAEFGSGRRAGTLSDYTFAVRDGEELKNVGKAYSGLTDVEIAELSQFFMEHTVEDFGSVRSVDPVLVLEVTFNNVMRSERHASGFALRFPRILRIRRDKPVDEIDTLARVEEIYASQPDRPVDAITE